MSHKMENKPNKRWRDIVVFIKAFFSFLLKNKCPVIAIGVLFVPILLYLLPSALHFHGKICAYDVNWRTLKNTTGATYYFIREMPVTRLQIKGVERITGVNFQSAGNQTKTIYFPGKAQSYSVRNVKVPGAAEFRVKFPYESFSSDGTKVDNPLMYLTINMSDKTVPRGISFRVIDDDSNADTLDFLIGDNRISVQGRDVKLYGRSIELIAHLTDNYRGDVFAFPPLLVSSGSMKFETGKTEIKSTVLRGHLTPQHFTKPITISEDEPYLILGHPGIQRLLGLTLSPTVFEKRKVKRKGCVMVRIEGQTDCIRVGMSVDRATGHRFTPLNRYFSPEKVTWVLCSVIGTFLSILGYYIQQHLRSKRD